ncbi:MAG: cytidine deaminase [Candidatus Xenobia bacterium]
MQISDVRNTAQRQNVAATTPAAPPPAAPRPDAVTLGSTPAPAPAAPPPATQPSLSDRLSALLPDKPTFIPRDRVDAICKQLNITPEDMIQGLIPLAQPHARPGVSQFHVGAAGLGRSGNVYLGMNMEIANLAIGNTTHGEQGVVNNALTHGERGLSALAVSDAPCGHCRQFLNELVDAKGLKILVPGKEPTTLAKELPADFGPKDLGVDGALLSPKNNGLTIGARGEVWSIQIDHSLGEQLVHQYGVSADAAASTVNATRVPLPTPMWPAEDKELASAALAAANRGYAPYSNDPSGIALRTGDGQVFTGSYAENAAFNPSLNPMQSALINLMLADKDFSDIRGVALVEPKTAGTNPHELSQVDWTLDLLHHVAPNATLTVYEAQRPEPAPAKS